ncbi:hypothetical protein Pmani_013417 [Petrolisthes manimaculis]|uniref:Uncharacterized protein n=1 Tax=Petrolisthes manimaculis TaxID=1843537 RepID=A0AAE1UE29_9EUCA|nr:hypothetical protein Pmani_013417 [Petrolisthes manimaculis]
MWKYKETTLGPAGHNEPPPTCSEDIGTKNIIPRGVGIGVASVVGAGAMVAAAPLVLTAAGFTAGGAAAGSMAASMMSSAAIANSGSVAAGSLVALLQSAGAAGIGTATSVTLGATGAAIGGGMTGVLTRDKNTNTDTETKTSDDDGSKDLVALLQSAGAATSSTLGATGAALGGKLTGLLTWDNESNPDKEAKTSDRDRN